MVSTCHGEGVKKSVLCGIPKDLQPWLKEERHKTAAGGATEVLGRHLARRGLGAAGLLFSKKDGNRGTPETQ